MTQELYIRLATLRRLVVNNGRQETWPASLSSFLRLISNRTDPNLFPLSFRIFSSAPFPRAVSLNGFERSDLAIDVFE
jgi:hypothetical protein